MTIPMGTPVDARRLVNAAAEPVVDRRSLDDPRAELLELEREG